MQLNQIKQAFLGAMILVLILTGQSMAQVRVMPAAVGQMVICTSGGAKTILMDAKGQPADRAHICPDCIMAFVYLGADEGRFIQPLRLLYDQSVHFELPKFVTYSFWAVCLPRAPPNSSDFKTLT